MLKKGIFIGIFLLFLLMIGNGFLVNVDQMFNFHDVTQAARIQEWVLNLHTLHIPPRISPNFSYGMGYPIFNHYAPTAYWITGFINLVGIDILTSLKLSFLLATLVAGVSMFIFARQHFDDYSSLFAGVVYAASPYIALETFVRGNLAEIWFAAFLPFVFAAMHTYEQTRKKSWFTALVITFSLMLTAHNALSIIGGLLVVMYALMMKRKALVLPLGLGIAMSAYFLLPAFLELPGTYATQVATGTIYSEHFVCVRQLWDSPWGFGGSNPGCIDGMSFQIGKVLIIAGLLGLIMYTVSTIKEYIEAVNKPLIKREYIFFALMTLISFVLIWRVTGSMISDFIPGLDLFQFPWRFMIFVVFGLAFFSGYGMNLFAKHTYIWAIVLGFSVITIMTNYSFFRPNIDRLLTHDEYFSEWMSPAYIRNEVAFRVPEYLPLSANYDVWMQYNESDTDVTDELLITQDDQFATVIESEPFVFEAATASQDFLINKHYAPYWHITINGNDFIPDQFDDLGRPIVQTSNVNSIVRVVYKQTPIELIANAISIAAVLLLIPYTRSWLGRLNKKA